MNNEIIGEFIKKLRQENQLTQKEFADKFGVTYQAVSKWENGKNIPDLFILKKISEEFNCDINELLTGKKVKRKTILKKRITIILFSFSICFIFLLVILCIHFCNSHEKDFEFKTLSSTCDTFRISGSIAYNKEQSSIYISHVEYCGEEEEKIYTKITCTLYVKNEKQISKINENIYEGETTLEEYLKNVRFYVDYSKSVCREYLEGSIYIEIEGMDREGKLNMYKIPLTLKDDCF